MLWSRNPVVQVVWMSALHRIFLLWSAYDHLRTSCWTMKQTADFFNDLWLLLITKHNEGIYNTVCVVVLLILPLLVFVTSLIICCHFCSSFFRGCYCCCCRDSDRRTGTQVEKKKKKNSSQNEEDLWISVKMDPMTPDRLAITTV